eukprot:TRINITY_DN26735_c0_g1_i1.p2 TRINITY_DN26735_c0_g1~~TRINITY_DN26735_c0_g1_i1.p2  ORF type:complete len:103 (-),score=20.03 TRINITY_DN26735_c0_g1_i1:477-785(-)
MVKDLLAVPETKLLNLLIKLLSTLIASHPQIRLIHESEIFKAISKMPFNAELRLNVFLKCMGSEEVKTGKNLCVLLDLFLANLPAAKTVELFKWISSLQSNR